MSLSIAVLAGGLATRMLPETYETPKILLPVADRPFAEHQIELFKRQGISRVVYCVSHLGAQIIQALRDGSQWDMAFSYSVDRPLAGTGGALRLALPQLDDPFFVTYGDAYLECDFRAIEQQFRVSKKRGLLTVYQNADYGLGILTQEAFTPWLKTRGPFPLSAVYGELTQQNALALYNIGTRYHEIGSPEGRDELHRYLLKRDGTYSPTD